MFKRFMKTWGLVIVAIAGGYLLKNAFGFSDVAVWTSLMAVVLLVFVYQTDERLALLEQAVTHPGYSRVKEMIENGERHKPEHKRPVSLIEGGAIPSFIQPDDEILFADFQWFGAILNRHVSEPWAIEEMNDTSVRGYDSPDVGRRYQVFCNAWNMGTIQVSSGGFFWKEGQPITARVEIELHSLRFVPYHDAASLLSTIALFIGAFDGNGDAARAKALQQAQVELLGYLWEAVRQPDTDPFFELVIEGPYDLLRSMTRDWMESGIDPFKEWGGDRSRERYDD